MRISPMLCYQILESFNRKRSGIKVITEIAAGSFIHSNGTKHRVRYERQNREPYT